MNNKLIYYIFIFLAISVAACAMMSRPALDREVIIDETQIAGDFSLILYGGTHGEDVETIAVLDLEGDEYTFEPFAPEFDFTIKEHLNSEDALREAFSFVSFHNWFWRA